MTTGLAIAALAVSLLAALATVAQALLARRALAEERQLRERQIAALEADVSVRPSVRTSTVDFTENGAEVMVRLYVTNIGRASEAFWEAVLIQPEDGEAVGRERGPAPLVPNAEIEVVIRFPRADVRPDTDYLTVAFSWGSRGVARVRRRSGHHVKYGSAWRAWQAAPDSQA